MESINDDILSRVGEINGESRREVEEAQPVRGSDVPDWSRHYDAKARTREALARSREVLARTIIGPDGITAR